MGRTSIEWVQNADGTQGRTWNPVTGCTKLSPASPGCANCYAESIAERFRGGPAFPNGFDVQLRPHKLVEPLRWRKPSKVFVNSMSDLFHDAVPDEYIARVFAGMACTGWHTYQLLTKRHARMRALLRSDAFVEQVTVATHTLIDAGEAPAGARWDRHGDLLWPLPNLWLGVSTENQQWADIRIPALLDTPAAVRFISAEPLLGQIDLDQPRCDSHGRDHAFVDKRHIERCAECVADGWLGELSFGHWLDPLNGGIDWVIVGGESGPGARPMHPDWAYHLRDQCVDAEVPFHFKQWGEWVPESMNLHGAQAKAAFLDVNGVTRPLIDGKPAAPPMSRGDAMTVRRVGKKAAGRKLDGRTWDQYPAVAS